MYKFQNIKSIFKSLICSQARHLNLQEYQSKDLMSKFGLNVQKFQVASTEQDAIEISKNFKANEYVIKAQILAGGRGKGTFSNGFKGGVHLTKRASDVPNLVKSMLGQRLITKQTSADGVLVNKVMVAEAMDIVKETYLALVMDQASGGLMVVSSPEGGMDIEEVARKSPSAILKTKIDINEGITRRQAGEIARHIGFGENDEQLEEVRTQLCGLFDLFVRHDCTQIEINPLGLTTSGSIVCFDAKLNFDDNAAFRQKEIFALHDPVGEEEDPREKEAARIGLNYIGLDGNIGCVGNGAGLGMATMDIVKLSGGRPANFLDLGGGVTVPQVEQAFKLLTGDPRVKTIFINIFGGIVNCATVAEGVTIACSKVQLRIPLIVRLEGTNVDAARKILRDSGLAMHISTDLEQAARLAVDSVK